MGDRAFTEAATADDLALMTGQLDAALRAGAIGFTTSQSQHHETSDDRPVASRLADWHEVRALAQTMSDFGAGIYEGVDLPLGDATDDADRERLRWERTRELTVELGVPFTEGLLATNPGGLDRLAIYDRIAAEGGRMIGQAHCRGINVLLSFLTRLPFDALDEWQEIRGLPHAEQQRVLRDPSAREKLVDAAMHGDYTKWRGIGAMPRKPDWDGIRVYEHGLPPNPTLRRARGRPQHHTGRCDDRSRARHQLRAAVHPAEPVPAGPRRAHEGAAPPAHGDDVLRLRRAHEPDLRLVDPHPPARLLGARAGRVHARGGCAHDHARARAGVGLRRSRAAARGHGRRRERVRSRRRRAVGARGSSRTSPRAGSASSSGRSASTRRSSAARSPSSTPSPPAPSPVR